MEFRIPLGVFIDNLVDFLLLHFRPFFRAMNGVLEAVILSLEGFFLSIPVPAFILLLALVAWRFFGRNLALLCLGGLILIYGLDLWAETMATLSLVLLGTLIALILGIPLGIVAASSDLAERLFRPALDFMQTLPSFVYLVPAVMFFTLGKVPGLVATVIWSLAPPIRLTNLGIRQVSEEVVEAAQAFGSTKMQLLTKVQLPLALPTIMAGVNQCIMMALSMTVISAMIGAGGLGGRVLSSLQRVQIGSAFESGIGIVVVAMLLDRFTEALRKKSSNN